MASHIEREPEEAVQKQQQKRRNLSLRKGRRSPYTETQTGKEGKKPQRADPCKQKKLTVLSPESNAPHSVYGNSSRIPGLGARKKKKTKKKTEIPILRFSDSPGRKRSRLRDLCGNR